MTAVRVDAPAGRAAVTASFAEAVEAHRGAGQPPQSFKSSYEVEYELEHDASAPGGWVITAAQVAA